MRDKKSRVGGAGEDGGGENEEGQWLARVRGVGLLHRGRFSA